MALICPYCEKSFSEFMKSGCPEDNASVLRKARHPDYQPCFKDIPSKKVESPCSSVPDIPEKRKRAKTD